MLILEACLGAVESTHVIKQNHVVAPMDAFSYEKKASPYLKSFKYYLQAL